MPALLKSRSSRPNVSRVFANSALTCSGSRTSVGTASVGRLNAFPSAAAAVRTSARRPANTTDQPFWSKAKAAALPIPEPAPVTTATRLDEAISRLPALLHRGADAERQQVQCGEREQVREADVVQLVHRVFPFVITIRIAAIHRDDGSEPVISGCPGGRVQHRLVR